MAKRWLSGASRVRYSVGIFLAAMWMAPLPTGHYFWTDAQANEDGSEAPVNPLYQQYVPADFDPESSIQVLDQSCQSERVRLSAAFVQDQIDSCTVAASSRDQKDRCESKYRDVAVSCRKNASGTGTRCENKFDHIPVCEAARDGTPD